MRSGDDWLPAIGTAAGKARLFTGRPVNSKARIADSIYEMHWKVEFCLARTFQKLQRPTMCRIVLICFGLFRNLHVTRVNYTEDTSCDPLTQPGSALARSSICETFVLGETGAANP